MAAKKWQPDSDIAQKLFQQPYSFNFFKAVHLLEIESGRTPGSGLSPAEDPVRFSVKPGFSFPASDIQLIETNGDHSPPKMRVNFMGMVGPGGVLPNWYNAHAENANYRKDFCFTDFLDMFHHRLISVFYRAWKKYRLAETYRFDGADPISGVLSHLSGAGESSERAAGVEFVQYAKKRLTYFCGRVARVVPTGAAIETIVAHATGSPVRVEQFVERMLPIHEKDRTCLGRQNGTLYKDALCGSRVRDTISFFRVCIGPMTWENYMAFAPRSHNLSLVKQLITYLAGIEYEFEVRLVIPGSEIKPAGIGSRHTPPILGRTMLMQRPGRPFQNDVIIRAAGEIKDKA